MHLQETVNGYAIVLLVCLPLQPPIAQQEIARPLASPVSSKRRTNPFVEPEDSEVSDLSKDTFDDFVQAEFAVVYFYMPWSNYCKTLRPQYTEASIELRRLDPDIK